MHEEHARLDVGRYDDPPLIHGRKPRRRIFEALIVPRKGASLDAFLCLHSAVSGRELESVYGNILLPGRIYEVQDRIVAVRRQLRIIHRGAEVPEGSPGQQHGFTGQVRIAADHVAHGRSRDQEQVDIACICRVSGIAVPVVALLTPHIEHAFRCVVVKISHCFSGRFLQLDVERNMLVEGICLYGVVAHGIAG